MIYLYTVSHTACLCHTQKIVTTNYIKKSYKSANYKLVGIAWMVTMWA